METLPTNNTTDHADATLPSPPPPSHKKRPGRKPNPASPALRKAQNRAAQRAFRERKERHIANLEETSKRLLMERDELKKENEELKSALGTLEYECWHLKGTVLTLQLLCLIHRLAIPFHRPYLDPEHLNELMKVAPEITLTYAEANKRNEMPKTRVFSRYNNKHPNNSQQKLRWNHVTTSSILVSPDGVHTISSNSNRFFPTPLDGKVSQSCYTDRSQIHHTGGVLWNRPAQSRPTIASSEDKNTQTHEQKDNKTQEKDTQEKDTSLFSARPIMLTREPIPSFSLPGFQTMRLRLHLQKVRAVLGPDASFVIEPTVLQRTIPHDPRIDLVPIAAMRDRMILFRHLFDLDDCLRYIPEHNFRGGDPAIAANWSVSAEFYEKYWFLCQAYSSETIKNRWPGIEDKVAKNLAKIAGFSAGPRKEDDNDASELNFNDNNNAPLQQQQQDSVLTEDMIRYLETEMMDMNSSAPNCCSDLLNSSSPSQQIDALHDEHFITTGVHDSAWDQSISGEDHDMTWCLTNDPDSP